MPVNKFIKGAGVGSSFGQNKKSIDRVVLFGSVIVFITFGKKGFDFPP
jgi:hypothetical protein